MTHDFRLPAIAQRATKTIRIVVAQKPPRAIAQRAHESTQRDDGA
jgi:hypothetical protein